MSDEIPSEPISPAAKYGKTSDFGQILDFIQYIVSNETMRQEFDIPHLVVVGRQNMAKTTLINRLIGRYMLPMRKGKTATHLQALTTYPIILNLRERKECVVRVNVQGIPDLARETTNPKDDDVDRFLRDVASRLPKEPGTEISKTPVTVTLYGPNLSTITLVDLPGVHFANDNDRMNAVTQSLMLEYIKKNKKSVIVIVSQVGDPTGDSAINLVMRHAEDYRSRTICVLTKPDKHNEADDIGRKVALNKSHFTLEPNHFILLKGKDGAHPVECEWDTETTRIKEDQWFSTHQQYSDLLHICGIGRLMDTMVKMLSAKMIEEIPNLIIKMKTRKAELDRELEILNQTAVPRTEAGKGKLMCSIQNNLISELEKLLFKNTTNFCGGEKVRNRMLIFNEEILQLNPLVGRTDKEIIKVLRKLEGVGAPLGDSSENNQLLEMLLYKDFSKESGLGLGLSLVSPIDMLTTVCERLVQDVEKELKSIVLTAVKQTLSVFPDLKKSVEVNVVSKIFSEKQEETMVFINQLIQMQKKSIDVVEVSILLPQDINSAVNELVDNHRAVEAAQPVKRQTKSSPSGIFGGVAQHHNVVEPKMFTQLRYLSMKLHQEELVKTVTSCSLRNATYKEQEQLINTKKNVVRCFNTIKLTVINTVPRCIQHFFVTQLVQRLGKELESKSIDLMEFLQEKEDVRMKRESCEQTLHIINKTLPQTENITPMLLRIKQGRSARSESQ